MWDCRLDVTGLAWSAVQDAIASAREVAEARGTSTDIGTEPALVASAFAAAEHLTIDGRAPEIWAPMSGFFEASDGWVRLHGNYPHHSHAITEAFGVTERDTLAAALRTVPTSEIEEAVTAHRGIAAVVRTPEEWQAHPHGAATAGEPWWRTTSTGPAGHRTGRRAPLTTDSLPLDGTRVLDLTRVIAGPTCSQLLACLGADVLRIDPPHHPEILEQHLSNGMGKRSAELDLRSQAEHLHRDLLPRADVVLLGYRPGALSPFGLDPRELAEDRPDLVIASLSAWGEGGPWAERPGFDSIVQAASGIASVCGSPERPGALPVQALDHATGFRTAAAVMRALASASGTLCRISLLGAARELLSAPSVSRPLLDLPTVRVPVDSPYGHLLLPPPPIRLDGRTIERQVGGYGAGTSGW